MKRARVDPVHPGEILREEFLKPMELSQTRLAENLSVPVWRVNRLVRGKRRVTADTALRLARYFNMSAQFWLGLQTDYDLDVETDRLGSRLKVEVTRYSKARA